LSTTAAPLITKVPGLGFLNTLVARRTLIYQMARRDFEQRFVGSVAGWIWSIVHPLVLLLSWVFVFQVCMKIPPPPDAPTQNYTLFLFCGYLPWLLFQETVQRASTSLLEQKMLMKKMVFPSEIVPLTIFLSSLVNHLIAMGILAMVLFTWFQQISPMIFLIPVYTLLAGLFAVGVAWVASSLQVYLRDIGQVVIVLLTGWFWITPIFLSPAQFPWWAKFLVKLNPLAYVVTGYRTCLLTRNLPAVSDLCALAAGSLAMFVLGGLLFKHLKTGFPDVL
jgi:homopolymeric O-antigen transport system permease protein